MTSATSLSAASIDASFSGPTSDSLLSSEPSTSVIIVRCIGITLMVPTIPIIIVKLIINIIDTFIILFDNKYSTK